MPTSTEQGKAERNTQAIASLILGVLSVAFALFNFAPGLCSALGCVGAVAAVLAFIAGAQGIRVARGLEGQGRNLAIAGMATGGLGLLVFIVVMASAALGGVLRARELEALLTPQPPQTFQGDGFTLTYPGGWQTIDISQQDICKQPGVECLLAIRHPSGDGTNINLMRFALDQEATVEEVEQELWAEVEAGPRDITPESREVVEIGGQPAVRRIFSAPSPDTPSGQAHLLQIYVAEGRAFYQLTVWAPSADALTRHRAEIEEIVTSIEFTPSEATAEAPTEQPSEHIPSLGTICDDKGCNGDTQERSADGMVMVYVPAGEFEMGSDDDEVDYAVQLCNEYAGLFCDRESFEFDEQPVHTVALDGFWIDQTEVTNGQYRRCVEAGTCGPPIDLFSREPHYGDNAYDDYPVIWVTWHQAADYCAWVGARLPTEAEWEYAARGPQGLVFPWGDEFDGTRLHYGYADTAPVGSYPGGVSWSGALDMAGNVWEWVADWHDSDYYGHSPSQNPTGPSSGNYRVLRGGSWYHGVENVRGANRYWYHPNDMNHYIGFRCVQGSDEAPRVTPTEVPTDAQAATPTEGPTPEGPPANASLSKAWIRPADEMVMVYAPAGEFEMGSDDNAVDYALQLCNEYVETIVIGNCRQERFENEQPAHTVALDGFWIDQTEVTNGQYRRCVEAGACDPPARNVSSTRESYYGDSAYDDYPVIFVSWFQAADYCAWAGARLPTEAEWEYAARGPEGRMFPWGDEFDGTRLNYCDASCELDWADKVTDDGYADTAPVGSFPAGASWCDALNMAGNVCEWVADWYGDYSSWRQVNPTGPSSGGYGVQGRVVRGGPWDSGPLTARCTIRNGIDPDWAHDFRGFRCARGSE